VDKEHVSLMVDGTAVSVPAGTTLREAVLATGTHTPTLCWHPHFPTGSNCRACVVEVKGSRTLVPSCSREAEAGMVVFTDSERVRRSRRVIFELLLSQVDLTAAPELMAYARYYGADPGRFAPAAPDRAHTQSPEPVHDNPFFVRDYAKCILCQRCTIACGTGIQHTFAISVVGRGAGATIGAGGTGALPDSPCVFCGNCVGVCPTGALMPVPQFKAAEAGAWQPTDLSWTPQTGVKAK
jgi:NADP-reducing hydrogenase subunit HndD